MQQAVAQLPDTGVRVQARRVGEKTDPAIWQDHLDGREDGRTRYGLPKTAESSGTDL